MKFGYKDTRPKNKGPQLKSMVLAPDGNRYPTTVDPYLWNLLGDDTIITLYYMEDRPSEKGKMRPAWCMKKYIKKVLTLCKTDEVHNTLPTSGTEAEAEAA